MRPLLRFADDTVTSVCTGALLLGKAGLLDGKRATTHWRFLDRMQELFPKVTVERQVHFVEEGGLFTSAGISAGIDMSLRVVARYFWRRGGEGNGETYGIPFPGERQAPDHYRLTAR
jgi:transcriptional regulator GlxA family with amidase domain